MYNFLSIAVLVLGLNFYSVACSEHVDYPISNREVSFMSSTPSGTIRMRGTLTYPVITRQVPAILLIHGSGPGERNETQALQFPAFQVEGPINANLPCSLQTITNIDMFVQLAENLAKRGYAVLRYDKRGCLKPRRGCTYELCPINNTHPPSSCVNLRKLTVTDFVTDAKNAVRFLQSEPSLDGNDITLIGHSQGCSVAPYVAANMRGVKNIIQLLGIGAPIDTVVVNQIGANYVLFRDGAEVCKLTNGDKRVKNFFEINANAMKASIPVLELQFAKLRNGTYTNREELIDLLGGKMPVGFWLDWLSWGNFTEMFKIINQNNGTRYLTINSPSDSQVWAQFYRPLHAAVMATPRHTIDIIQGLTHMLIPASLTSRIIDQRIISSITNFLANK